MFLIVAFIMLTSVGAVEFMRNHFGFAIVVLSILITALGCCAVERENARRPGSDVDDTLTNGLHSPSVDTLPFYRQDEEARQSATSIWSDSSTLNNLNLKVPPPAYQPSSV